MADFIITNNQHYKNIADAIREKSGTNVKYKPAEMAPAILNLEAGEGPAINNQDKTVTPTTNQQLITADSGYTGLGTVTVQGDTDLIAGNIKSGVDIFGVTGTLTADHPILTETINSTGITANITTVEQPLELSVKNITASGTYSANADNVDGYSQVVVDVPIPTGTVVSKTVGEGESISKGDFVTWNNDYWYFTPSEGNRTPVQAGEIFLTTIDSPSNPKQIIFSYNATQGPTDSRNREKLLLYNVLDNSLSRISGFNISGSGISHYPHVTYLEGKKVLYSSRVSNSIQLLLVDFSETDSGGEAQYYSPTEIAGTSIYTFTNAVQLNSNTVFLTGNNSNLLQGIIVTINHQDNTLVVGDTTQLSEIAYSTNYNEMQKIDDSHIFITHRSGTDQVAGIITINDGVPSLIDYYQMGSSSGIYRCYSCKLEDGSILVCPWINDTSYVKKLIVTNSSISLDSTLWSEPNNKILSIASDGNTIGLLLGVEYKLFFVLLSLNGTELARAQIYDYDSYYSVNTTLYHKLVSPEAGKYVAAFSNADNYFKKYAGLSLITWDGSNLKYQYDHLESYNGESLYGIALEDGEAGDTIQVLIPNAPEENTEGE